MATRSSYTVLSAGDVEVVLTDRTMFDGQFLEFRCTRKGIEGAQRGDIVSADMTNDPTLLTNPFLERGAAAAAIRPAPFIPDIVKPFNPNATDAPFLAPDGSPLSPTDIDTILRKQERTIADLTGRVRKLEAFAPRHCYRCKSHIDEPAFS